MVEVGDKMALLITRLGREGDGMGYEGGLVIFVPNTEVGQDYDVEIVAVSKNCAFAEVLWS